MRSLRPVPFWYCPMAKRDWRGQKFAMVSGDDEFISLPT
jgi:hypothetical protein